MSTTSGWMSRGANGISDSDGTSLWLFSRLLINATSMIYFPAFRSASTRLTVSVALPVDTSTLTPNFFWKTSTTGRYWREGAPPEAIATVPSCFAAATSLDHSWSKFAVELRRRMPRRASKKSNSTVRKGGWPYAYTACAFIALPHFFSRANSNHDLVGREFTFVGATAYARSLSPLPYGTNRKPKRSVPPVLA